MTKQPAPGPRRSAPKRWIEPPATLNHSEPLHDHPLMHQLLLQRGITTASEAAQFLDHAASGPPDPFMLKDMELAVDRIARAVASGERIAIYGDYDVDGVTSAAIMHLALQRVVPDDGSITTRLPTRDEGYGLNRNAIDAFATAGTTLLISVDCGSTDEEHVAYAISRGMDVIVVDHHHMATTGPQGAIVLSPARPDGGEYREMSAAGLSLLLTAALETSTALCHRGISGAADELVDLAALGIVADVSSMLGANRGVVREGLRLMRSRPRIGLQALCECASTDWRSLSTVDLGFRVAPRLNAAGRMDDPRHAFDLLMTGDPVTARRIAARLEKLNYDRKRETDAVIAAVLRRFDEGSASADSRVVLEMGEGWRAGILGLAAGKLVEQVGRPVVLLTRLGDTAVGSARSVEGFSIIEALHRNAGLMERFGGHSQAAGLSAPVANVDSLRSALDEAASNSGIALPIDPQLVLNADIKPEDLTLDVARLIIRLSPFGVDNPEPVLRLRNVHVQRTETMGNDRSHLRLIWRGPRGEVRAPFFGAAHRSGEISSARPVDLACTLSISQWNGPRVDVKVLDFRDSR